MDRGIIWNKRAETDLSIIVEYLQEEWNDKVTKDYLKRVSYLTTLLSQHPEIGTSQRANSKIRAFFITKHSKIIYRITTDSIIILNIFDNRQDLSKFKY
jgi:plasmid stabilization system protein ParE